MPLVGSPSIGLKPLLTLTPQTKCEPPEVSIICFVAVLKLFIFALQWLIIVLSNSNIALLSLRPLPWKRSGRGLSIDLIYTVISEVVAGLNLR